MIDQLSQFSALVNGQDTPDGQPPQEQQDMVQRETPEVDPARKNLVTRWCKIIQAGKKFHKDVFDQMRKNMVYARLGADEQWKKEDKYIANIIQRHINLAVAQLYAKNPKAVSKRKPRLDFTLWDGQIDSLTQAFQQIQQAQMMGMPPDPNAMALLMEVEQVKLHWQMLDRLGKTQEILFNYYLDEQEPDFKAQMKQLVRRTKVCGVGYIDIGFQRIMEANADVTQKIADVSDQIAEMERILADVADDRIGPDDPQMAELKAMMETLQSQEQVIVREGPVFGFHRSTEVIIDPRCRQLKGFIGANWLATELLLTPSDVQRYFKVDIGTSYTTYTPDVRDYMLDPETEMDDKQNKGMACVWRVQDKRTGTVFVIVDGYPDFLKEPAAPDVKLEQFWTTLPLTFNDIEDEKKIFPPSDVELIIDMQDEYNRSRQGLREHRQANRPMYVAVKGRMEDEDKDKLVMRPANALVELSGLAPGEDVGKMIQAFKPVPIDPALYDTRAVFDDTLRTAGSQEANLGGTTSSTATESSIAESSRVSGLSSNVDDLDEFLSKVARSTGQLMLLELDANTVFEIVGTGAVWPSLSREEIVKEIFLEIKAGSSGKPNRAAELANLERGMPFIMQLPGINPKPLGEKYLSLLDIDVEGAIIESLPSIQALNSMAGKPLGATTGNPQTDPAAQGGQGQNNAQRPHGAYQAAQERGVNPSLPVHPAPGPGTVPQNLHP